MTLLFPPHDVIIHEHYPDDVDLKKTDFSFLIHHLEVVSCVVSGVVLKELRTKQNIFFCSIVFFTE